MIYADWAATVETGTFGNANSIHSVGWEAKKNLEEARKVVAICIGAEPEQIFFNHGASDGNRAVLTWGQKNDGVTALAIEHESVLRYANSVDFSVTSTGEVDFPKLKMPESGVFSVGTINNEIGTIQDIKRVVSMKSPGTFVHTDATQAVGTIPINVEETGVDFLTCSAHKFGGRKGLGFTYIKNPGEIKDLYDFEYGTQDVQGICEMAKILEFETMYVWKNQEIKRCVSQAIIDRVLNSCNWVVLTGPVESRSPSICSFLVPGVSSHAMVSAMDEKGICISGGSACKSGSYSGSHVLKAIGFSEEDSKCGIRISIGKDTTLENAVEIAEKLNECLRELRYE